MTDTIRELILRVFDYVERTPDTDFRIIHWYSLKEPRFSFRFSDGIYVQYVSRENDIHWSDFAVLTEDNLGYLLSQLEGKNDSI